MSDIMLACGCVAQAKDGNGKPVCISHIDSPAGHTVVETPDLTGRQAKCAYGCNNLLPSSPKLAFFKFKGEGSPDAVGVCKHCHYHRVAHEHNPNRVDPRSMMEKGLCQGFEAQGAQPFDEYYCGCRGWD
jgi:hypothetical protein